MKGTPSQENIHHEERPNYVYKVAIYEGYHGRF